MKIGVHGREFEPDLSKLIQTVFDTLSRYEVEVYVSDSYAGLLSQSNVNATNISNYNNSNIEDLDAVITLGGDGTLLEAVSQIGNLEIPILGINIGRLGFLATTAKENFETAISRLINGNHEYDNRVLLRLETEENLFGEKNFALNDFTILKKDTSSMIVVHTYINGDFLNSYWADGMIVSTPTGSTGYSLSCGGPLVLPQSNNFIITPVSPHNLTARPLVVSDDSEITFEVEGRSDSFLVSLDSRFETIEAGMTLKVSKEAFKAKLVRLPDSQLFDTLRQKLHWGIDIRN